MHNILKYFWFLVVTTLWITIAFILPDFWDNPISDIKSIITIGFYLILLGIASFWILALGTIQKHFAAILLPIFAIIGSIIAYFRIAFHATITPIIIEVTFQTNIAEVASVISWALIGYILLNLVIAALLLWWRWRLGKIEHAYWIAGMSLAGLLVYYNCNSRLHQSINQRFPYNVAYNLIQYSALQRANQVTRTKFPIKEIMPTDDDLNIIVVLGEAIRADHLSINGYHRPTTQRLSKRANLINLGDVYSIHTHTSASVPHLLTPADSTHLDYAQTQESFIPYVSNAGFYTSWISNQDITPSYAHFIYSTDTLIFPNSEKSVFVFDSWTDLDLIDPISSMLNRHNKNVCIVHTIGCHWYYNNHIAPNMDIFQPTTSNRVITYNDSLSIINSYDNCIATMDLFVDSLCSLLENKNALLIYQSDHGESLGEQGNWLHAAGAEETKHAAGFIWYSETYKERYPNTVTYMDSLQHLSLSTDYLFPFVLFTAGIQIESSPTNQPQQ